MTRQQMETEIEQLRARVAELERELEWTRRDLWAARGEEA